MTAAGLFAQQGVAPTPNIPAATIPASGPLAVPPTEEDQGPPDGLTLDQAIDRLIHENLTSAPSSSRSPRPRPTSSPPASGPTPSSTPTPSSSPTASTPATGRAARPSTTSTSPIPLDLSRKRQARTAWPSRRPRSSRPSIRTPSARRSTTSTPPSSTSSRPAGPSPSPRPASTGLNRVLDGDRGPVQRRVKKRDRRPARSGSSVNQAEQQLLEARRPTARPSRRWRPSSTSRPTRPSRSSSAGRSRTRASPRRRSTR